MRRVTQTLLQRLNQQIDHHGTVVWYDPQGHYAQVVATLQPAQIANAEIHAYTPETGYIALRRELEATWGQTTSPPRLLIYVPAASHDARRPLVEYEVAGVILRPGQQPPEQDTALVTVARQALDSVFPPAALQTILTQIGKGQLSLAELDVLAEKGAEPQTGAIAVLFGASDPFQVALRFLSDPALDGSIQERSAVPELAKLFMDTLGLSFPDNKGTIPLRAELARQILTTDFLVSLGTHLPRSLQGIPLAEQSLARQAAVKLAQLWRDRREYASAYVQWADQVVADLRPDWTELDLDALAANVTFAVGEEILQARMEVALSKRSTQALRRTIADRLQGFWAIQRPAIKTRWEVIQDAAAVMAEAARVESALRGKSWRADALLSNYALGETPWCALDTAQRHLERSFSYFDVDHRRHDSLIKLVTHARQRYADVAGALADTFVHAYADSQFMIPGVLLQADVYRDRVASQKGERIAYFLVDGLRFEMATDLLLLLDDSWQRDLTIALATPPTITEIGMAALLPGAERGITVVSGTGGKLAAVVDGAKLKDRKDRIKHFNANVAGKPVVTTLSTLAPLSSDKLRKELEAAGTVLVTASDEIDGIWEKDPALARRIMDDALNQLRRGIHALFQLGFTAAIITADHGFLFGAKLTEGQLIDAPGGDTAALKRRAWIGKGGSAVPGTLRKPLSALGVGGDLELVTPYNLSCFKVPGGGMEYYHGGLSLPELAIPVLTVRSGAVQPAPGDNQTRWALKLGSATITARFISVTVEGSTAGLLAAEMPMIRVEVRSKSDVLSVPVSATYGFDESTKDVQLAAVPGEPQAIRANTITLMITEETDAKQVTICLIDAKSGRILATLDKVGFSLLN